jgi:tetratricopeptide (TPR) repeat protein
MDAKSLYQEGLVAIRDEKDLHRGRSLLMQSLRLDPENEMAWLWLSKTVGDKDKKLQCLERALAINPTNQQVRAQFDKLSGLTPVVAAAPIPDSTPPAERPRIAPPKPSGSDAARIKQLLNKADALLKQDKVEDAIEQWVRVLEIEVDHEVAMANAVRHLSRLKYIDDARELVWNALDSGTQHPSIYLTAIDIARYQGNQDEADSLRLRLARLPEADEKILIETADYFIKHQHIEHALTVLESAIKTHPRSQKLKVRLAELYDETGRRNEALEQYEAAARAGAGTKEGRLADERLLTYMPTLTDKERGSIPLAIREAFGFGTVYLFMAWQDAGLDLLRLGVSRSAGVALAVLGGYLLITATSSPQQKPLARWFGGQLPPTPEQPDNDFEAASSEPVSISQIPILPVGARAGLGLIGAALLIVAFTLVFSTALNLFANPQPATVPTWEEVFGESGA